ncbi:MAG: patatin-like phospholipase family protein [Anaerolineales bacterium]|nr:patatin-like phospholipase family protein [Anaerolineales bacterium]
MTRPKIGLVLGGGGSRGLAHIGVLEVLVREGIPVDLIVGTSMGGIVGVLFGLGLSPAQIAQELSPLQGISFINRLKLISSRGRQQRAREHFAELLEGKTFADLALPVTLMAVDMVHGQEVTLAEGPLLPAVLASSAVPGAFPPVNHNGMQLADGGVIDSLATHVAYAQGADRIIAVDVYPPLEKDKPWTDPISAIMGFQLPPGLFSTSGLGADKIPTAVASMWRSVRVMTWYLHQQRLAAHPPHVLLRPEVSNYGSLDFKDVDSPRQAGAVATERCLKELQALIEWGY